MNPGIITPQNNFVDQVTVSATPGPDGNIGFQVQAVRIFPFTPEGLPAPRPTAHPLPQDAAVALLFRLLHDTMKGLMQGAGVQLTPEAPVEPEKPIVEVLT